jgi:hypothetical protein
VQPGSDAGGRVCWRCNLRFAAHVVPPLAPNVGVIGFRKAFAEPQLLDSCNAAR